MSKRIAVYGATGSVGSALLIHLMKGSVLRPGDAVVLVGRGTEASHAHLLAMRTDLMDAFSDGIVSIHTCPSVEELETDVFIMAAGATISRERPDRRDLAEANASVFESTARALAAGNPEAFVFVISNPVELAVSVFAQHFDRTHVIGIGAQQDSLRFTRAIADQLDMPRSNVRASVLGEHGKLMLPMWSSVYLTESTAEQSEKLASLRSQYAEGSASELLERIKNETMRFTEKADLDRAYQLLHCVPPEVRIVVEPSVTAAELHSTPNATANATLSCLQALLSADERKIHGQVLLDGEFYGLRGVCGAPILLHADGWRIASGSESLTEAELERLRHACDEIGHANENALVSAAE